MEFLRWILLALFAAVGLFYICLPIILTLFGKDDYPPHIEEMNEDAIPQQLASFLQELAKEAASRGYHFAGWAELWKLYRNEHGLRLVSAKFVYRHDTYNLRLQVSQRFVEKHGSRTLKGKPTLQLVSWSGSKGILTNNDSGPDLNGPSMINLWLPGASLAELHKVHVRALLESPELRDLPPLNESVAQQLQREKVELTNQQIMNGYKSVNSQGTSYGETFGATLQLFYCSVWPGKFLYAAWQRRLVKQYLTNGDSI